MPLTTTPPFVCGEREIRSGYSLNFIGELVRSAVVEFKKPADPDKRFALVDREADLGIGWSADPEPLLRACLDVYSAITPDERRAARRAGARAGVIDDFKHYLGGRCPELDRLTRLLAGNPELWRVYIALLRERFNPAADKHELLDRLADFYRRAGVRASPCLERLAGISPLAKGASRNEP